MSYELTLILRITDNIESLKELIKKIFQKYNVTVINEQSWDAKKMAYPIDDESEAYYYLLNIESPTSSIDKLIADFRLNNDILRYFFIRDISKKTA